MSSIGNRLQHAWNAFFNKDPTIDQYNNTAIIREVPSYQRPDRLRLHHGNERSIVTALYSRIAMDTAAVDIEEVKLDSNERYVETIDSGLTNCLKIEANIDQTGRELIQDIVMSMFDEGVVAVVPVDTTLNPNKTGSYDILSLRTGKITEWRPNHVKVKLYNEKTGNKEEILLSKSYVAIIQNPLYYVMNEPNSTLQRLIRKLNILDAIDEQLGAGKMDLIIQLPYVIRSEARKEQAELRRKDIEQQLMGSKYGIAYTDGTERITQLNRPVENNMMNQIEYLTSMLYSQLGISEEIFNGTANEQQMLNYHNRTIEPILSAITDEMTRKFLTKTSRTQGHSVVFINDPFKLVPVSQIAEVADKFTRNEILSSNELRAIIGYKPVDDARADELRNKNLNANNDQLPIQVDTDKEVKEAYSENSEEK